MEEQAFNAKPAAMAETLEKQIPKEFHEAFARVVKAGMKVMFSKETHDDVIDLISNNQGNLGEVLGQQIANLMALLFEKSNGSIPGEVIIPAGMYLLTQGADFLEQVTGEEASADMIAEASQVFIDTTMGAFGVDPQKFHSATETALAKYAQEQQP